MALFFPRDPPVWTDPRETLETRENRYLKFLTPKRIINDTTLCPFLRYSVVNFYYIISIVCNIFHLVIVKLTSYIRNYFVVFQGIRGPMGFQGVAGPPGDRVGEGLARPLYVSLLLKSGHIYKP